AGETSAHFLRTLAARTWRPDTVLSSRRMSSSIWASGMPSIAIIRPLPSSSASWSCGRIAWSGRMPCSRAACATRSTRIVSAVGSASGDRIVRRTACHASTNSCRLNDASVTAKVPPTTISSDGTLTNAAAEPPSQTATPPTTKPLTRPMRVARSTRAARRTLSPMSGGSAAACAATMGARRAIYTCSAAIRLDDLGHGHAEAIIDHHHLAARDQSVVYVDVDRLADLAVQLDHGATAELQQLADLHRRLAEHRRHLHRNVVDGIQIRGGPQPLILAVALAVLLERDRDRLSQLLEIETFLLRHPILHFARSRR